MRAVSQSPAKRRRGRVISSSMSGQARVDRTSSACWRRSRPSSFETEARSETHTRASSSGRRSERDDPEHDEMSVDKSLVSKVSMARARNVYTRGERIEILKRDGRITDKVLGLPKTRVEKVLKKTKGPKEKKVDEAGAPVAAGAPGAAAPAGKGAAA